MLSLALILVACVYYPGIIVKVKALFSGRKGPGIFQPWFDISRLLKKGSVYSSSSSYIFQIGAPIYFVTVSFSSLRCARHRRACSASPRCPHHPYTFI